MFITALLSTLIILIIVVTTISLAIYRVLQEYKKDK
jgi:hypothetical protein